MWVWAAVPRDVQAHRGARRQLRPGDDGRVPVVAGDLTPTLSPPAAGVGSGSAGRGRRRRGREGEPQPQSVIVMATPLRSAMAEARVNWRRSTFSIRLSLPSSASSINRTCGCRLKPMYQSSRPCAPRATWAGVVPRSFEKSSWKEWPPTRHSTPNEASGSGSPEPRSPSYPARRGWYSPTSGHRPRQRAASRRGRARASVLVARGRGHDPRVPDPRRHDVERPAGAELRASTTTPT